MREVEEGSKIRRGAEQRKNRRGNGGKEEENQNE